jgi:hypothetical protein
MTADEGRSFCGMFGCITGRGENHGHNIKMFGRIVITDSYYLWFINTVDEPILFRLKYVESFCPRPEGKKMLKLPHKFKKYVNLHNEFDRKKGVADVVNDPTD